MRMVMLLGNKRMSGRCTAYDLRSGYSDDVLIELKKADPSGTRCLYVSWIYKQYKNNLFLLEDVLRVREDLELYEQYKSSMNKDINTYTYETLKEALHTIQNPTIMDLSTDVVDAQVLYDGPYGNLSIPLTEEASCKLGSGTKWCTAAKSRNMFNQYNKDGHLYIWYDREWNKGRLKELGNKSKKFQFHFETMQFMDELDTAINRDVLHYFASEHPVLHQLFLRYASGSLPITLLTGDVGLYDKYVREHDFVSLRKEYDTYIHDTNQLSHDYEVDILRKIIDDIKDSYKIIKYIRYMNSPRDLVDKYLTTTYGLFNYILSQSDMTWEKLGRPELDTQILSDPKLTVNYMTRRGQYLTLRHVNSDNIVIRALVNREKDINTSELIKLDKQAAMLYYINVLRKYDPILKDSNEYYRLDQRDDDHLTNTIFKDRSPPDYTDINYTNEDEMNWIFHNGTRPSHPSAFSLMAYMVIHGENDILLKILAKPWDNTSNNDYMQYENPELLRYLSNDGLNYMRSITTDIPLVLYITSILNDRNDTTDLYYEELINSNRILNHMEALAVVAYWKAYYIGIKSYGMENLIKLSLDDRYEPYAKYYRGPIECLENLYCPPIWYLRQRFEFSK